MDFFGPKGNIKKSKNFFRHEVNQSSHKKIIKLVFVCMGTKMALPKPGLKASTTVHCHSN